MNLSAEKIGIDLAIQLVFEWVADFTSYVISFNSLSLSPLVALDISKQKLMWTGLASLLCPLSCVSLSLLSYISFFCRSLFGLYLLCFISSLSLSSRTLSSILSVLFLVFLYLFSVISLSLSLSLRDISSLFSVLYLLTLSPPPLSLSHITLCFLSYLVGYVGAVIMVSSYGFYPQYACLSCQFWNAEECYS